MENNNELLGILGMSADDHSNLMYETGIAYLKHYIGDGYDMIIDEISRSKTFWNWWKLHWEKRDQVFIETVGISGVSRNTAHQLYREVHDANTLSAELNPNGVVLGESYATMIGKLQKLKCHAV